MERTIKFLKYKNWIFISTWAVIALLVAITMLRGGFVWGIDFVGGHKIIASFQDKNVNEGVLRTLLKDFNPTVQQVGDAAKNEYIITTKLETADKNKSTAADKTVCLPKNDLLKKTLFEKYPLVSFVNIENGATPYLYKITAQFQEGNVTEAALKDYLKDYNTTIQKTGNAGKNEFIINADFTPKDQAGEADAGRCGLEHIKLTLGEKYSGVRIESEETVGPAIGEYLRKSAWKLTLMAVILMSIYLAFRFEFKYSVGGMVCLFHDMVISIAFCGFMGIEFDIQILAALLTLYGYSINDTIVIFDRIRETNQIKSKVTFEDVINKAITQTLSRTILTGVTTLFALFVLFFFGGEALHNFAFVMLFGILIGTYSSVYVASPVVLWWEKWRSR